MGVSPILVVFGAIYHWYPKITGRMLNDTLGKIHFWMTFLGTYCDLLADALPRHPRRAAPLLRARATPTSCPQSVHTVNEAITIAALIVAAVQLVFLYNMIWSYFNGKPSGGNPWRATTLEWQTPDTPPKHGNWGPDAAGRLSLGVRLQRAGRRRKTSSRRTSRRPGRDARGRARTGPQR